MVIFDGYVKEPEGINKLYIYFGCRCMRIICPVPESTSLSNAKWFYGDHDLPFFLTNKLKGMDRRVEATCVAQRTRLGGDSENGMWMELCQIFVLWFQYFLFSISILDDNLQDSKRLQRSF